MTPSGRNAPCHCGSGKKFKKCCLGREVTAALSPSPRVTRKLGIDLSISPEWLLKRAFALYHSGVYWDCIDVCQELVRVGAATERSTELHWLAYAALRGCTPTSLYECRGYDRQKEAIIELTVGPEGCLHELTELENARPQITESIRSLHPVERTYLRVIEAAECTDEIAEEFHVLRNLLKDNLWIIPSAHPSTTLNLAHWLVRNEVDESLQMELTNCCLGWRYSYKRIDDLIALARLLGHFRMPLVFWTNLLTLYVDFAVNDSVLRELQAQHGQNSSVVTLHQNEMNWLEGEFHKYCASHGLPDRDTIIESYLDALGIGIARGAKTFPARGNFEAAPFAPWLKESMFQMRHPWFCLLQKNEQNFIRNADTAFCACITEDYSFACSQWWRCIESVLKRKFIEPLGHLIDENPQWLNHAGKAGREKDKIFEVYLADPEKRQHLALSHMLILLAKSMKDLARKRTSSCIVRQKVVEHLSTRMSEFRWVTGELDDVADFRSVLTPPIFTDKTIKLFRNAASHDKPMSFTDASVGRLIAIRILDFMHYPRYCVESKLDELKQEIRNRSCEHPQ